MNRKVKTAIMITVYAMVVILILRYLNAKRAGEYSYTADLADYTVSGGIVSEEGSLYIDESFECKGEFAYSPGMQFRTGEYDITVNYRASGDNTLHLSSNANYEQYIPMPAAQGSVTARAIIYPSADDFRIWLVYDGSGELWIDSITVTGDKPLYTDYEYYMVLVVLLSLLLPIAIWYMACKKAYTGKDWIRTGILAAACLVANFPVFYGYLWMGVDTRPHLMRMDGVSTCIEARRIPTVIYSNYCNGYGELSCIYPDKFLYLAGLLRNRGVSLLSSYNTMQVIVNIAAVIIMYRCVRMVTGNTRAAAVSAILFCFLPYRMYVVGAAGQTLGSGIAMLFFPMVFTGLYDIFIRDGKKWYLLVIGMASIACSHILSFALVTVLCIITVIALLILCDVKGRLANITGCLAKSAVVGILLCLSTIVPFVYYYSRGLNMGKMSLNFLDSLATFAEDYLQANGIYHLILLVCAVSMIVILRRNKHKFSDESMKFGLFMTVMGFGLFVMSTGLFPWKLFAKIPFIYKGLCLLQFSERFMLGGSAAICIGIGILIDVCAAYVPVKSGLKAASVIGIVTLAMLGTVKSYVDISKCDPLIFDRMTGSFYYRQLGYLPPGTEISYYDSKTPNLKDWDSVENITYTKTGTDIHYVYKNTYEGNYIEFPLFIYDGYKAYDGTGRQLMTVKGDENRIRVDMESGPGEHVIDIVFAVNPIFYVCAGISALATLVLYGYIIGRNIRSRITGKGMSV